MYDINTVNNTTAIVREEVNYEISIQCVFFPFVSVYLYTCILFQINGEEGKWTKLVKNLF